MNVTSKIERLEYRVVNIVDEVDVDSKETSQ